MPSPPSHPPVSIRSPLSNVRTKGTSIAAIVRFINAEKGAAGLADVTSALRTPALAELVAGAVLAGSWFPFTFFMELLDTAAAVFGEDTEAFARREGAACADYDLRGVYRAFVRLTSPAFVIERSGKVWRQYYDSGELVVLEAIDGKVDFELRSFGTPHRGHCATVLGWSHRAAQLSGASAVRGEHPSCRARGDRRCLFHLEWR
jgi:hypothetical protein